jgi:protein SCO1
MNPKPRYHRMLCAVFTLWLCAIPAASPAASADLPRSSVYQLDASLTDQDGIASHWRDGANPPAGPRIVGMFYSRCDYVCPMLFEAVKSIEASLPVEARQHLQVGLITLDPARDDTAALKKTALQRAGDPARWHLYRTHTTDVRELAGVLGVQYRQLSNGEFNHSTLMILLDGQGIELARTEQIAKPDARFLQAVRKATAQP